MVVIVVVMVWVECGITYPPRVTAANFFFKVRHRILHAVISHVNLELLNFARARVRSSRLNTEFEEVRW